MNELEKELQKDPVVEKSRVNKMECALSGAREGGCKEFYELLQNKKEQEAARRITQNISAYLQKRFPSLELSNDNPVDMTRKVLDHLESSISASEALYGFCSWLICRDKELTLSAHHSVGKVAELVVLFCEVNDLAEPHKNWEKKIVLPKECSPEKKEVLPPEVVEEVIVEQLPRKWVPYLEQILFKLSGDLSHNNIGEAKQILKRILSS